MPPHDLRAYLWDVVRSAKFIQEFTQGKTFEEYERDAMLRSAVERQFEIIGEALNQAIRHSPDLESKISSSREIVAFRNLLINAYMTVDPAVVWGVIEENLPILLQEAESLLAREGESP